MKFAPASAGDVNAILALIRRAQSPTYPYTILACDGAGHFIDDSIRYQGTGGDAMWVGAYDPDLIAICEMRTLPQSIFLNQIYVADEAQGSGIGGRLTAAAIDLCWHSAATSLELDVVEGNDRAHSWYERLGLTALSAADWGLLPLTKAEGWAAYQGLPAADLLQERYGFSTFNLLTEARTYTIGRLGTDFFRVMDHRLLDDPGALSGLHALDSSRQILCIRTRMTTDAKWPSFLTGLRMRGPLDIARSRLK